MILPSAVIRVRRQSAQNGSVTDASQIDKVVEIAKGVPGVTSVTNKLAVKKPFGGM